MIEESYLQKILEKYNSLGEKLSTGLSGKDFKEYSKQYSELDDLVVYIKNYQKIVKELADIKELLKEESDQEIKEMLEEELRKLQKLLPDVEHDLKIALLPKDEADNKDVIIEIRAGAGGGEAALFVSDLLSMYQHYSERKGWKFELLSISETGIGGYKEICASITGKKVFSNLKFESGVHRVQRVPLTEASGRIHTSTATVAVLPVAEEIDVKIDPSDVRIDVYRASGAGGQHVNTTDSAVRLTHIPTGIVVCQQDERSQHRNKEKAFKILRSRIYDSERQKLDLERSESRKNQIGSGDRSERIRTYNFPQGRVSDHRINLTLYQIESIVKYGELDELIEALVADYEAKRLVENF